MNHVRDFRNIDFCVIVECLNKVIQFSPKFEVKFSNKKIENC